MSWLPNFDLENLDSWVDYLDDTMTKYASEYELEDTRALASSPAMQSLEFQTKQKGKRTCGNIPVSFLLFFFPSIFLDFLLFKWNLSHISFCYLANHATGRSLDHGVNSPGSVHPIHESHMGTPGLPSVTPFEPNNSSRAHHFLPSHSQGEPHAFQTKYRENASRQNSKTPEKEFECHHDHKKR